MAKYTDAEVSEKDLYGKPEPRPYREAVSPEHLKVLKAAGQEPRKDDDAAAAAADANAPEAAGAPAVS